MSSKTELFDEAIANHDARIASAGLDIWMGGEPTFTDRMSFAAEWNSGACGDEKYQRATIFAAAWAKQELGSALLRTLGRQYPDEDVPRWSFGVYSSRQGQALWQGPADPIAGGATSNEAQLIVFRDALASHFGGRTLTVDAAMPERIVVGTSELDPRQVPALARPPWDLQEIPDSGPVDELAEQGVLMFACGLDGEHLCLCMPAFASVQAFRDALRTIELAAHTAGVTGLILGGYPPPVDETICWTTVTPDPGVLEINTAPHATLADYARDTRRVHEVACATGLQSQRLYYNGDIVDSGGGGQLTFGGPSPARSPFFSHPQLLPRLVTYFNRHPSLSYWLGLDAVGGSSQAPRPDEGARETFEEMGVALDSLRKHLDLSPETLWGSLAPHLTDRFGNSHRCEINIEKLYNPGLPMRGKLGLVEFRALRMARSPERAIATALLLRSLLGYLATTDYDHPLIDWGAELHDRFALPFYLQEDFSQVLAELAAGGFAMHEAVEAELLDDSDCLIGSAQLDGMELRVRRAREFWPLLGDLSQERGTHRLVDPSTARIEVQLSTSGESSLSPADSAPCWTLSVDGHSAAMRKVDLGDGRVCHVLGVRYRAFVPNLCLHPLVPAHGPLVLRLQHRDSEETTQLSLFDWAPDGVAYDGLPRSSEEARQRRVARFVMEPCQSHSPLPPAPARSLSAHAIDTRRF